MAELWIVNIDYTPVCLSALINLPEVCSNNVSDGGTLDVLVPGFTHCKYVALSTNAHLVEHSLGL